ncbi:hypothetical protein ACH5RR_027332 [Cinchona calisaya]|uniref:Ubiquitin-like domain-containing protein n=1 Tax=Cinchona calisaya TaxID=153742 RepID=A0ABD2Z8F9_9GENT
MRVVVEILTGRLFYVEMKDDATVSDLKKEIGFQEQLPFDRLILLVDGNESFFMSENQVSLKDYGIKDGSHVYLFFDPVVDDDGSWHSLLTSHDFPWCSLIDPLNQQSDCLE